MFDFKGRYHMTNLLTIMIDQRISSSKTLRTQNVTNSNLLTDGRFLPWRRWHCWQPLRPLPPAPWRSPALRTPPLTPPPATALWGPHPALKQRPRTWRPPRRTAMATAAPWPTLRITATRTAVTVTTPTITAVVSMIYTNNTSLF